MQQAPPPYPAAEQVSLGPWGLATDSRLQVPASRASTAGRPRVPRAAGRLEPYGVCEPLARKAMAVATTAALLAALGGSLWLLVRRFVGREVLRLHGGGDADLMRGKTVLITGANSGLGRATAAELLRLGARVIMGCRDRARAEEAAGQLRRELGGPGADDAAGAGPGELVVRELDLASLRSVRAFCRQLLQVGRRGRCPGGTQQGRAGAGPRPRGEPRTSLPRAAVVERAVQPAPRPSRAGPHRLRSLSLPRGWGVALATAPPLACFWPVFPKARVCSLGDRAPNPEERRNARH